MSSPPSLLPSCSEHDEVSEGGGGGTLERLQRLTLVGVFFLVVGEEDFLLGFENPVEDGEVVLTPARSMVGGRSGFG